MPPEQKSRIDVVGLGPAGPELITTGSRALLECGDPVFLRTDRHPSAAAVEATGSFDHHYERAATVEDVYVAIVDELLA